MDENEVVEAVTEALRTTKRINLHSKSTEAEKDLLASVLYDFASELTRNLWPTRSEEAPAIPEEWDAVIKENI